ncbi:RHS repeat-associated core domain-containing protein [Streptomyces sp. NPDC002328]|uniref:RHS repeat-associated core domain-containing protein n=1 Tax=Streptomyces sp. NPDC002328 TaxID=3364642 RepID=UPI00367C929B
MPERKLPYCAGDTLSGMTLMGARQYDPATGRFLQSDPLPGGGANAYGYPPDPITMYDLTGEFWGTAYKVAVCACAVAWVLGTAYFAVTKVRAIWRAINRIGGIRAAVRRVMSAPTSYLKTQRMANLLITTGAAILGLDAVYEKCIKVKW